MGWFHGFSGTQHYLIWAKHFLWGHFKSLDTQLNTFNIFLPRSDALNSDIQNIAKPALLIHRTHVGLWEAVMYLLLWQAVRIHANPATFLALPSKLLTNHRLQHFESCRGYKEYSTWLSKCKEALLKIFRELVPLKSFPIGLRWEWRTPAIHMEEGK